MKKLIFQKFNIKLLKFFTTSLLVMGLIVWTLQAVNYFDYVTEDGHGLKVYFFYTILSFPKIIDRIFPFIFFISLFYLILSYESKNELNIFWLNGVTKSAFLNKLVIFSLILMVLQFYISSFLTPLTQFKARNYLKNSNMDFFSSLLKSRKFINIAKGLTIFIDDINEEGVLKDIFLEDKKNNTSRMIYAKTGFVIEDNNQKLLRLIEGRIINNDLKRVNVVNFKEIDFNLKNLVSKTIIVPKIQEIDTKTLLSCFFNFSSNRYQSFNCEEKLIRDIKQELLKRLYKPLFIPIIALIVSFIIVISKQSPNYKKITNLIFFIAFMIILFAETSIRYSLDSEIFFRIYLIFPFIIFSILYLIFFKITKNA